MTDNPLVSIIVPMFNAQKSVGETIRSVQAQTYKNWEMLVCDNCSTDNSRDLIKNFMMHDDRIRLIESDHNSGGPARPRNTGIRNAKGKYLAFLDTDDIWLPEKLEKEVNFLNKNSEYFLVYSKCFVKENGKISSVSPKKVYSGNVFNRLYLEFNFIACMTVMMLNLKGPDQYFFSEDEKFVCIEDYMLWLAIAKKHKIGSIDEPLATYVLHGNNLSAGVFKTLKRIKIGMDEFARFVPRHILIAKYILFFCKFIEMSLKQALKIVLEKTKPYFEKLKLFFTNPVLFYKKAYIRIRYSLFAPAGIKYRKIGKVVFEFNFKYDSAVKFMYHGIYQEEIINFMKKHLSEGDVFIDVGANIGFVTANAASMVGKSGQVHSFEPVPQYFEKLKRLSDMNKGYKIQVNQFALGELAEKKQICVTNLSNIGWNTIVPGFMPQNTIKEKINIEIARLDDYLANHKIENVRLIKIDTEGFEFPVLKGLSRFLKSEDPKKLPIILCEIAPQAYSLLGCSLSELAGYMANFGYSAYCLSDLSKSINLSSLDSTTDVVFKVFS